MSSDLPVMVPLSVAEIRRLFFRLVNKQSLPLTYWSFWRRMHQALAQLCHYKRRSVLAGHLHPQCRSTSTITVMKADWYARKLVYARQANV